jgi:hypothetical protein
MKRRDFITLLGGAAVPAQQPTNFTAVDLQSATLAACERIAHDLFRAPNGRSPAADGAAELTSRNVSRQVASSRAPTG